jgi:hypothetical protein
LTIYLATAEGDSEVGGGPYEAAGLRISDRPTIVEVSEAAARPATATPLIPNNPEVTPRR